MALAWRDGVRERWRWIRKGEGVAIRFSSRRLHPPMCGVAPRRRFFHFFAALFDLPLIFGWL